LHLSAIATRSAGHTTTQVSASATIATGQSGSAKTKARNINGAKMTHGPPIAMSHHSDEQRGLAPHGRVYGTVAQYVLPEHHSCTKVSANSSHRPSTFRHLAK